jgi:hypothetical protein
MPGPPGEEESSASEQEAEDFEDAPSPEPAPEGPPWWQTTIDDLGRGVVAEAGVIQAALQLQSQAVAAAAQERADRREELRERREAEREEREQRRFDALEAARVRDAEKLTALEAKFSDQLEKEKSSKEPDFREFAPRAAGNPFGRVAPEEREGDRAEPQLRDYSGEKTWDHLEGQASKDSKSTKNLHNYQALSSACEGLFDGLRLIETAFPQVVLKVNPDRVEDDSDPQYQAELALIKAYNTVKAVYDNCLNPQLSYLQVEAILHRKYPQGGSFINHQSAIGVVAAKTMWLQNWKSMHVALSTYIDPLCPATRGCYRFFGWLLPPSPAAVALMRVPATAPAVMPSH